MTARRRRWLRLVVPVAAAALFWVLTLLAHVYQQPNLRDPGTLSPTGTGRHGSSELAQLLRDQGVEVIPVTSTRSAVTAADRMDATIFVPAPDLLDWWLLSDLVVTGREHRIVLVRPTGFGLNLQRLDVIDSRWATQTVQPGCAMPEAVAAGPAAVHRDSYRARGCYRGSLIEFAIDNLEVVVVGATDPFRNDRIDEGGNAALATGLLSRHGRVIWLDIHQRVPINPELPEIDLPDYQRPEQDRDRTNTGNPLLDSFPEQLWVGFVLLLGAGLLVAVARARRLGVPVSEPLPVLVPASEAVLGRGRLYRRIRARSASLDTLRAAALARLARALDPVTPTPERGLAIPGPQRDAFLSALAARTGLDESAITAILFGPAPTDDPALVQAVADLDQLVAVVVSRTTPPTPSGGAP